MAPIEIQTYSSAFMVSASNKSHTGLLANHFRCRSLEQGQGLSTFQGHPDAKKDNRDNYQSFYHLPATHAAVVVVDMMVSEPGILKEAGKLGVFQSGRFQPTIAPRADLDRQVV